MKIQLTFHFIFEQLNIITYRYTHCKYFRTVFTCPIIWKIIFTLDVV